MLHQNRSASGSEGMLRRAAKNLLKDVNSIASSDRSTAQPGHINRLNWMKIILKTQTTIDLIPPLILILPNEGGGNSLTCCRADCRRDGYSSAMAVTVRLDEFSKLFSLSTFLSAISRTEILHFHSNILSLKFVKKSLLSKPFSFQSERFQSQALV